MNHRQKKKHDKKIASFFNNMAIWAKTADRARLISQEEAEKYRRTQIPSAVNTAIILTERRKQCKINRGRVHTGRYRQ